MALTCLARRWVGGVWRVWGEVELVIGTEEEGI